MKKKHRIIKIDTFLYVLSDDEIKEGDWYLSSDDIISKPENFIHGGEEVTIERYLHVANKFGQGKIIATTDPKLSYKSLAKILAPETAKRNGWSDYPLPQIPQSLIEYYAKHQPEEVELEYELVAAGEIRAIPTRLKIDRLKLQENEIVWVEPKMTREELEEKHKMYSREEVEELCEKALIHGTNCSVSLEDEQRFVKQWLKENL